MTDVSVRLGAAVLVTGLLAACGSPSARGGSATTSTTAPAGMTRAQAAEDYQSDVGPANAAVGAFQQKAQAWTDSTTATQAEADAQPLIRAINALEPKLLQLAQQYPSAATDLKAQVTAAATVAGDLTSLGSQTTFSASSWVQGFTTDAAKLGAASKIVRSDLGLPTS